jgi:hypothetical protein
VGDAGATPDGTAADLGSDTSIDQWPLGPDECANGRTIQAVPNSVEMIIALDRSTSMQQHAFGATTSRWTAARQAIEASTKAHSNIQFGLVQFPTAKECGGQTCCADRASFQPYHSNNIDSQLACESGDAGCPAVGSDSPSQDALRRCRESFSFDGPWQQRSSQFVVLITDQDPACAGDTSAGDLCGYAVNEASRLGKIHVQTFVVSLNSDGSSTDCLTKIADANANEANFTGSLPLFEVAQDEQVLGQKLEAIMTSVEANSCRFFLMPTPNNPDQVVVTVNGKRVAPNSGGQQGGVSFPDPSILVLSGSSCTDVTSGQDPTVWDCSP